MHTLEPVLTPHPRCTSSVRPPDSCSKMSTPERRTTYLQILGHAASIAVFAMLATKLVRRHRKHQEGGGRGRWLEKWRALKSDAAEEFAYDLSSSSPVPSLINSRELASIELGSTAARALFYHDPSVTLLNHGSYGAVPRVVMRYFERVLQRVEAYPDLWFREHSWLMVRDAIRPFAQFLKCDPESLVFVNNATSGVNAVLSSIPLEKGEVVLTADCTYRACKLAMKREAARRGAEYVEVPLPLPLASEEEVVTAHIKMLDSLKAQGKKVRFLLVDAITSPTAIVLPYERLARLARERGILCMVDAAHAIGCIEVDLGRFEFDYFTTNLHKWLFSIKGTALLFASKALRASLHPLVTSHNTLEEDWTKRFWMQATRDDGGYLAAVEGLRFAQAVGRERSREYTQGLLDYGTEQLQQLYSKTFSASQDLICPPSMRAPTMRLVRLPWSAPEGGAECTLIAERLMLHWMATYRVVLPVIYEGHSRAYWVRMSAQIYNRKEDYDRMREMLEKYEKQPMKGHVLYA
jgi:isopenicillin-N epimerase